MTRIRNRATVLTTSCALTIRSIRSIGDASRSVSRPSRVDGLPTQACSFDFYDWYPRCPEHPEIRSCRLNLSRACRFPAGNPSGTPSRCRIVSSSGSARLNPENRGSNSTWISKVICVRSGICSEIAAVRSSPSCRSQGLPSTKSLRPLLKHSSINSLCIIRGHRIAFVSRRRATKSISMIRRGRRSNSPRSVSKKIWS